MKQAYVASTGAVDTAKAVENYIKTSYNINSRPRLIADWNLNLYNDKTADNTPSETALGFDPDMFPISSIYQPFRPNKGINKALVNQSTVATNYANPVEPHFYVGSVDDNYKYWLSPLSTDASGVMPLHTDSITTCRPTVTYTKVLKPNKIVLRFENTWASPNAYRIRIQTTVGGAWTTIASNIAPDKNGVVNVYYNGTAWVSARPAALVQTNVAAIRLEVDTLTAGKDKNNVTTTYVKTNYTTGVSTQMSTTGANSNLALIAIEPHLEADITAYLINASDSFEMAEDSQIYPIGTTVSNTAELTLSNTSNLFNNENTASPYFGLLGENVELRYDYIYKVNNVDYYVEQFKMYTDDNTWSGQFTDEVSISATDQSKVLKKIKPRPTLIENRTVSEIVWRLCDSVGFNNYKINKDYASDTIIPIFWVTGETTVWEVFDDLSTTTQTAIYFDGQGTLNVKTSRSAFVDTTPAWTASGLNRPGKLTDIMDITPEEEGTINQIDVRYKTTSWKVGSTGEPALSQVWEPEEENIVVRSAPLQKSMNSTSTEIWLTPANALIWPYESKVNIDGEILSYDAKQFTWFTYTTTTDANGITTYTNPITNTAWVTTHTEYLEKHGSTPAEHQSRNFFTGALRLKQRSMWNTTSRDHSVDADGWNTTAVINSAQVNIAGMSHNKVQSMVKLAPNAARMKNANSLFTMYRGAEVDTPFKKYGTRVRVRKNKARPSARAGLHFSNTGSGMGGYFVELRPTTTITTAESKKNSEVMLWSKKGNNWIMIAKGARVAVLPDKWYDLEVSFSSDGTQHGFSVWLNGAVVLKGTTKNETKQTVSGRYGIYTRAKSEADFEYVYGVSRPIAEPDSDFGFYDLVYGGMRSGFWQREFVYEVSSKVVKTKKKPSTVVQYRKNDYFFDEFGPYVHEIKEFKVNFEPSPVQASELFNTNEWYSVVLDYSATPFGASFAICNVARKNAVIHGEDSLIYNSLDNAVNQVCTVLGRDLVIAEDATVTVKNNSSIESVGVSEAELSGDWIQSKEAATLIGKWIAEHWSSGKDSLTVELFSNPLIEIGDVVAIDHPVKYMAPSTHKYFVVGVENAWEAGLSTVLRLRKVNNTPSSLITVE